MGWWAKEVMSGDLPLDFEDYFFHVCGVEKFSEDNNKIVRNEIPIDSFTENLQKMIDYVERDKNKKIGYQVLGHLIMTSGFPMSEELRNKIEEAAKEDFWGKSDPERKGEMESFIGLLNSYNGEGVEVKRTSLMEALHQKINGGQL